MTSRPGKVGAPMVFVVVMCTPKRNSAMPATSGASRQAEGAGGVARRVTPSGEMRTRRSETSAATAAATGTTTSMPT